MLYRCHRFVDGWMAQADPTTKLIPRNLKQSRDIWNAEDSAGGNYQLPVHGGIRRRASLAGDRGSLTEGKAEPRNGKTPRIAGTRGL